MLHIHIHHMLKALVIYFQLEKKKEFLLNLIRMTAEKNDLDTPCLLKFIQHTHSRTHSQSRVEASGKEENVLLLLSLCLMSFRIFWQASLHSILMHQSFI